MESFEKCKSLAGIKNYNDVCESTGVREYDELSDKGTGTSFWNGDSVGDFNSPAAGLPFDSLAHLHTRNDNFHFLFLRCVSKISNAIFFCGGWGLKCVTLLQHNWKKTKERQMLRRVKNV